MTRDFIPLAEPDLSGNETRYVTEALREGWVSSTGKFVDRFESEFAEFCGVKHAIAACNGTAAIHLMLSAMGIGSDDEVIVPTFTFVASANAIAYTGATPVFIDSEPMYWNLDPARLESLISPHTRAIMAVHLYGHPADMEAIHAIAEKHNVPIIEDAAEAHGAEVNGRRTGSLALAAGFSLYGNKVITTGEGGMVTTDDDELAARVRQLRGQGMDPDRRYWFPILGYNYRMTNVAAALGCAQLERIDEFIASRLRIADDYHRYLAPHVDELGIQLPAQAPWARNVYWLYSIRVRREDREPLMKHLAANGIDTRPFFIPMHALPMYRNSSRASRPFPVAEELGATGLNLPTFHTLSGAEISRICDQTLEFLHCRS